NVIEIQYVGLVGSVTVDPPAHADLYCPVCERAATALNALRHTDGVFHLELFEQANRLAFSQCAGSISRRMVLDTPRPPFCVYLYDEWTRALRGLPSAIGPGRRAAERAYGWVHLPARPGRVRAMPGREDLLGLPGVEAVQLRVRPGDTVPDTRAASNARAATVMLSGTCEDGLAERMRKLADWFRDSVRIES